MIRVALAAAVIFSASVVLADERARSWPKSNVPAGVQELIKLRIAQWRGLPASYKRRFQVYAPLNDYLNSGAGNCKPTEGRRFYERGIAQKRYRDQYNYHPVLSAICGLKAHGRFLRGEGHAKQEAILYAEHMMELQDSDGAFRYPFAFRYYLTQRETLPLAGHRVWPKVKGLVSWRGYTA